MNPQNQNPSPPSAVAKTRHPERKSSYKDRLLKKKSSLTQSATVLTAAAALASISQQAEAAIIFHEYNAQGSLSFNPITGDLSGSVGPDIFRTFATDTLDLSAPSNGGVADGTSTVGDIIGASTSFSSDVQFSTGGFIGTTFFIGFELNEQGPADDQTWFGWAEIGVEQPRSDQVRTLLRSAIDDTGAPITVPEPSTTLLGGLACAFAAFSRRRKKN